MIKNIVYDCRWSKDVDEKFINDFNYVQDKVFNGNHTRELFHRQYLSNPYGNSILVVVYINKQPSAARGLWRNDINGNEAYQPGRTCVIDNCRGLGIFTEMTNISIEMLPDNVIIYNFPNQFSYPGYLKMGWRLLRENRLKLFCSNKCYEKENPSMMDKEYFDWWVKDNPEIRYLKLWNNYYLVRKHPRPFCHVIVSKVDKSIAKECLKATRFGFYFYSSTKRTWYNKWFMPVRLVCKNADVDYIPGWKIDAL